jgi:hypothetical protein
MDIEKSGRSHPLVKMSSYDEMIFKCCFNVQGSIK